LAQISPIGNHTNVSGMVNNLEILLHSALASPLFRR
jgi:hypothetical protein